MKKFIVNEDWETVEVEDTSSFFVLIFKQGTAVAGYIKAYSVDDTAVLAEYESLISQYDGIKFVDPASILVIKVPATGQVKAMLEEAEYTGDETNQNKIEIINHLLGRADCEVIKEKVLMTLEEAKRKKKKKRKSTPKVTYLTGFPWLNDHRFNHACGSCDCDKNPGEDAADNVNDAIGSGESTGETSGDFGGDMGSSGGESGGMGESLVNEAMTPLDKMRALEAGTRGFNAAAASDQKLLDNYKICMSNGLVKALKIVVTEITYRMNAGTWTLGSLPNITPPQAAKQPVVQPVTKKIDLSTFDFYNIGQHYLTSVESAALKLYVETDDIPSLIKILEDINVSGSSSPEIKLSFMFAMLVFALYMKYDEAIQALRDAIIKNYGFTAVEIKQYIKDKILSNTSIINKVQQAIKETLDEQKQPLDDKLLILETLSRLDEVQAINAQPGKFDFDSADILTTFKRALGKTAAWQVSLAKNEKSRKDFLNQLDSNIYFAKFSTEGTFGYLLAFLIFAIRFKDTATIVSLKNHIMRYCNVNSTGMKEYIQKNILTDSNLVSLIDAAALDYLTENKEQKTSMNLTEAKRYIKRYYIRPQNVFASNKAEILQRLAEVEADGANCSVYSLKALEDHDDVHLLQPKDIIYYYDDGVLYDKNHVPVLDYDLNVKNEEERPKISPDATSDERFKDVYQDRMTDRTIAESFANDFYLDFEDVNAFGIKLHEGKEAEYTCCICGDDFEGYGNNPVPYKESGKCCDACNRKFVIPARLMQLQDEE